VIKGNSYQINRRGGTEEGTLKLKLALSEGRYKNHMRSCFSLKSSKMTGGYRNRHEKLEM
jgi:hypothetical protein